MPLPVPPRRPFAAIAVAPLAAIVALLFAAPSHAASPPCAATTVAAGQAPAATVGRAVRCLVNARRAAHHLAPLRPSHELRVAAEAHGADMVAHRFFAHVSPFTGAITDRARRAGYVPTDDYPLGGDIAGGGGGLSPPASIVTAWMNSPGHRAVILDGDFRDVGVGIA